MKQQIQKTFLQAIKQQLDSCELLYRQNNPGKSAKLRRCLLAVSGGADSIALTHGLYKLTQAGNPPFDYLHIAHLNHQLRGEQSDRDAAFVKQQAAKLAIDATIASRDVTTAANELGISIETAARKVRYDFLIATAQANNCGVIATGHNADDNVETILHRIIRGTGLKGLAGIPPYRLSGKTEIADVSAQNSNTRNTNTQPDTGNIILLRPLLTVTRQQIEEFLKQQQVSYRTDNSNFSLDYTRNKLRHELLVLLRKNYNNNISTALTQLGHIARQASQWMEHQAGEQLPKIIIYPSDTQTSSQSGNPQPNNSQLSSSQLANCQQVTLNANILARQPEILQSQLLRQLLDNMDIPQQRLGYKHIQAIINILKTAPSAKHPDNKAQLILPYGLKVTRQANRLIFARTTGKNNNTQQSTTTAQQESKTKPPCPKIYITIPGTTILPPGYTIIATDIEQYNRKPDSRISIKTKIITPPHNTAATVKEIIDKFKISKSPGQETLNVDALQGNLYIRHIEPGDRFGPLGTRGNKKLGDFFTDNKVPLPLRQQAALLCDQQGIIWILGLRIAERVKITPTTRRLISLTIGQYTHPK